MCTNLKCMANTIEVTGGFVILSVEGSLNSHFLLHYTIVIFRLHKLITNTFYGNSIVVSLPYQ